MDEICHRLRWQYRNTVLWGIGFGITDVEFRSRSYYSESINNAMVPGSAYDGGFVTGTADYTLANYKHIWGSGFNFKAGVILSRSMNSASVWQCILPPIIIFHMKAAASWVISTILPNMPSRFPAQRLRMTAICVNSTGNAALRGASWSERPV